LIDTYGNIIDRTSRDSGKGFAIIGGVASAQMKNSKK